MPNVSWSVDGEGLTANHAWNGLSALHTAIVLDPSGMNLLHSHKMIHEQSFCQLQESCWFSQISSSLAWIWGVRAPQILTGKYQTLQNTSQTPRCMPWPQWERAPVWPNEAMVVAQKEFPGIVCGPTLSLKQTPIGKHIGHLVFRVQGINLTDLFSRVLFSFLPPLLATPVPPLCSAPPFLPLEKCSVL